MATTAASSASEPEVEPQAGPEADKRREDEDEENEWGEEEEEQPSKRRRTENSLASGEASAMKEETELSGKCLTIDVGPPSKQKEKAASLKRDMPKVAHDSSKDSVTVFVSNLPYSIEEPEVKLRPLFEVCGEVVQIRPIFSNRGDFRGYCYVEFGEEKSAQQALETEGLGTCLRSHRFSSGVDGKGEPMVNMAVRSVPSH